MNRDISVQLKRHTEERVAQFQENEKLKEKLSQLLKFEELREEHFNQQLRTKELENKLTDGIPILCHLMSYIWLTYHVLFVSS